MALVGRDALAAIEVSSADLNIVRFVVVSDAGELWQLVAGTDADDPAGGFIHPVNYAATTNEYVWKRIL